MPHHTKPTESRIAQEQEAHLRRNIYTGPFSGEPPEPGVRRKLVKTRLLVPRTQKTLSRGPAPHSRLFSGEQPFEASNAIGSRAPNAIQRPKRLTNSHRQAYLLTDLGTRARPRHSPQSINDIRWWEHPSQQQDQPHPAFPGATIRGRQIVPTSLSGSRLPRNSTPRLASTRPASLGSWKTPGRQHRPNFNLERILPVAPSCTA